MAYPGGKNGPGVAQLIVNQIPPHRVYLEPFLGGGAVWRLKRPAALNLGLDRDGLAVQNFSNRESVLRVEMGQLLRLKLGAAVAEGCALRLLRTYPFQGDEFVYLDPPYLASVRSRPGRVYYRCEFMQMREHEKLLDLVVKLPARVAISGYLSPLYTERLAGWRSLKFEAMTRGGPATESLWFNYPEPEQLHDYRFLGSNKMERQCLRRMKDRWQAKLDAMPRLKRQALLAALEEKVAAAPSQVTRGAQSPYFSP